MSLDAVQIGAVATGIGSLIGGTTVAIVNGLFGRRSIAHTATMETIAMLRDGIREAVAREREAKERVDELDEIVREHHDVIRTARRDLAALIARTDLPPDACRALEKLRDKLDTRIR